MIEPRSTETVSSGDALQPSAIRLFDPGTEIAARYEIKGVLGVGGSAVVYRVFDLELKRELGLKVLRHDRLTPAALTRFRREVSVARRAQSPRLLRVYDITRTSEAVFLTMDIVEGSSLRERLREGPASIDECIRIGTQVLEGLSVLHENGIVHRDVKPANILLDSRRDVKLADFGLAVGGDPDESRATATDAVVGTTEYLSPEQALGKPVDARSDLYSFGVVLYEMLTGAVPFRGQTTLGTLLAHVKGRVPDPSELRAGIPRWLSRVVRRLLSREPSNRYANASAVLEDLRRQRARRFSLRRIAGVVALASILGVTLLGGRRYFTRGRHFSSFIVDDIAGARAIGTRGEILWKRPEWIHPQSFAMARLSPGGQRVLAGIDVPGDNPTPDSTRKLLFLDPESGRVLRQVSIPSAAGRFFGFADRYTPLVRALDLDGDGIDEIIVTFCHVPYWPSYVVMYEPKLDRARILFVASGHHRFMSAVDVDGDGRKDLIFAGPANRMGFNIGVAALKIDPPVGVNGHVALAVSTPDEDYFYGANPNRLWYALVPRGTVDFLGSPISVDEAARRITLTYQSGNRVTLGFDGFDTAYPSPASSAIRQAHREKAYSALQEAMRAQRSRMLAEAQTKAEASVAEARLAGDPLLEEWASRNVAKILVARGEYQDAQKRFAAMAAASKSESDISFDAALSFHVAGDLPKAVAWYRRGLGNGGEAGAGRLKYEFLEGLVLALVESGQYGASYREIQKATDAYSWNLDSPAAALEAYVQWRSGSIPDLKSFLATANVFHSTDLTRYWYLEFRLANGEDPGRLLGDAARALKESSSSPALLQALQAELLDRVGRQSEAVDAARQAFERASVERMSDPEVRAHFDLITRRFIRIAERAGRSADASRAAKALADFRRRRKLVL